MYCKHCGKEIEDDSLFCKYCGRPLNYPQKALTNKSLWIIYLIWVLANLYLLMGKKCNDADEHFFLNIFDEYCWDKYYYDFSDFIIYVFFIPAILYVIYRRHNKQIDKAINKLLNPTKNRHPNK